MNLFIIVGTYNKVKSCLKFAKKTRGLNVKKEGYGQSRRWNSSTITLPIIERLFRQAHR